MLPFVKIFLQNKHTFSYLARKTKIPREKSRELD